MHVDLTLLPFALWCLLRFTLLSLYLQVGYGNAAGSLIFLTSFFGVMVFRRCVSDAALILMGMLSFASGIYFMSFVRTTSMFYLGEHLGHDAGIVMGLRATGVQSLSCDTVRFG